MLSIRKIQKSAHSRSVTLESVQAQSVEIIEKSDFSIEQIKLSESNQWLESEGAVRHFSGKFFSNTFLNLPR